MYISDGRPDPLVATRLGAPDGTAALPAPRRRFPPVRASLGQPPAAPPKPKTPQQLRWPCDATPPRCMTSAVSSGEFGRALQYFTDSHCVNNNVPFLLTRSTTFMTRVATLDGKFLALDGPALCKHSTAGGDWWQDFAPDANGVLTKGPFLGRRVLKFLHSPTGSLFLPAGSVDNGFGYDLMVVRLPDGIGPDGLPHSGGSANAPRVLAQWIAAIAHETTHAFNLVTATGSRGATIPLRVAAAITEEAATRATEARILAEIVGNGGGVIAGAVRGMTGATAAWTVQRDFFPGNRRGTYLENFVLSERMIEAIRAEKLSTADIDRIDKEIDAIELQHRPLDKNLTDPFPIFFDPGTKPAPGAKATIPPNALFRTIATDYGKFRFWQRVMDARWKRLLNAQSGTPAVTDPAREKMAQEHAKAFFGGLVKYDAIPRTP